MRGAFWSPRLIKGLELYVLLIKTNFVNRLLIWLPFKHTILENKKRQFFFSCVMSR